MVEDVGGEAYEERADHAGEYQPEEGVLHHAREPGCEPDVPEDEDNRHGNGHSPYEEDPGAPQQPRHHPCHQARDGAYEIGEEVTSLRQRVPDELAVGQVGRVGVARARDYLLVEDVDEPGYGVVGIREEED